MKSLNGGFLVTDDYDFGVAQVGPTQYYTGSEQVHTASFTFDFEGPNHCSVTSSCSENMLDRGPAITKQVHCVGGEVKVYICISRVEEATVKSFYGSILTLSDATAQKTC